MKTVNDKPFITSLGEKIPFVDPDAFVDISARIIGEVHLDKGVTVWPMAVLRADSSSIHVGRGSAILDLVLVEAPLNYPVSIGENCLISHGAMIHGATILTSSLVGVGAIVLDGATISSGSVVAAGSLVPAGTVVPPNTLVMGSPARVVRETTPGEREALILQLQELSEKTAMYRNEW